MTLIGQLVLAVVVLSLVILAMVIWIALIADATERRISRLELQCDIDHARNGVKRDD